MKVVGANRKETRISITLAVDKDGEYAFDEDGDPIKGRIPVTFTVPRLDAVPREKSREVFKAIEVAASMTDENGEPMTLQDRGIEMTLAMIRPFVSAEVLALLASRPLFELEQIGVAVTEGSTVSVGELLASSGS